MVRFMELEHDQYIDICRQAMQSGGALASPYAVILHTYHEKILGELKEEIWRRCLCCARGWVTIGSIALPHVEYIEPGDIAGALSFLAWFQQN